MYSDAYFEQMYGGIPAITQIDVLMKLLDDAGIPYEVTQNFGRPQVWYPNRTQAVCDAICHWGSYGHEKGLIEIMGLVQGDDTVEGSLTAREVFNRIQQHYEDNYRI